MRYVVRYVLIIAFSLGCTSSFAAQLQLSDLRAEYATDPIALETQHPRLSWILQSSARGEKQSAYQVLAASSEEKLQAGAADLWDSGKIASDQSIQLPYRGKPLVSRQQVYWKVRVWDKSGQPSAYSQPAKWEMGLLSPKDWTARWIGYPPGWTGHGLYFRFHFMVKKPVKQARAYIAGLGYYELHLNGKRVGDRVLDPGFTTYGKRVLYSTYDVSDLINQGANAVGVILGNGWYGSPKMIVQVEVTYTDGTRQAFDTHGDFQDENWLVTSGPIISNSIYDGEVYDARLERPGWDMPERGQNDLNDRPHQWVTAEGVEAPGGKLLSETVEPIKIVDTLRPKTITEVKPGIFVYDVGQNMAGWAELHVKGQRGDTITMRFAENLRPDGTADQENLRKAGATDTYILKGTGEEQWEPRFTYHGFRYVEIEGFPGKPTLDSISIKVVRSALEPSGQIETSSDLINRIQKMVWWTEASNVYSVPTDCPQRDERMGWLNDLTVRNEGSIYNFRMGRFFGKFLDDISDTQEEDGTITDTAPFRWGQRPADPVDASYLLLAWNMYWHYGDKRVLEEHFDGFKAWVDYVASRAEDGIVPWGTWGDWSPPQAEALDGSRGWSAVSKNTPYPLMSTAFLSYSSHLLAEMARVLGKPAEAAKYDALAKKEADVFNRKYWDEKAGGYGANNQASNSIALYMNLVPADRVQRVVDNIVNDVKAHDYHLTTGNICTKYLLEVLITHGHGDIAYKIANQETYPSWGFMLANGATTLWERWELLNGYGMNSHNHPMMGSVSAWFYKYLGGINVDPATPGFNRFIIRPYPLGDLTWVRSEYASMHGPIRSSWSKEGASLHVKVSVPVNTIATVFVPSTDPKHVMESGNPASTAAGVKWLRNENGSAVFEVGSGDYEFVAQ
jgi:alpha-L-rhamnosidase